MFNSQQLCYVKLTEGTQGNFVFLADHAIDKFSLKKIGLGTHHYVFHRFHHIREFYSVASLDTSTKVNNIFQIALVQVASSHSPVVNPKAVSRDQNIAFQSSKPAELALQKLQKYGNHGKRQKPWTISLQLYNKTHNKCMSCRLQS